MKYLDMSVRDCQDIRHFLIDIQMMLEGKDLSFSDDCFMYEGACFDTAFRIYMQISKHLSEAARGLNELENVIRSEDRKELAS